MRILYTTAALDLYGGTTTANVHFMAVARGLVRAGHHVSISCTRSGKRHDLGGAGLDVASFAVPGRSFRWYVVAEIMRFFVFPFHILKRRPDAVYARRDTLDVAPAFWARFFHRPYIPEFNGDVEAVARAHGTGRVLRWMMLRVEHFCMQSATRIVCASDEIRETLHARYPTRAAAMVVIENGVDVARFRRPERPREAQRQGPFRIGFVGSMRRWHGLEELVDAVSAARDGGFEVEALLWGDGPERDRLGGDRPGVRFLGRVPHDGVPGLLATVDVAYMRASPAHGGKALKLHEYVAAGLPVIVAGLESPWPGFEGAVLTAFPGTADGIREHIERLATRSGALSEARRAAHETAVRDWQDTADEVAALVKEALSEVARQDSITHASS